MRKVIIFGSTQFAEVLNYFLQDNKEIEVCGFTVDSQYRNSDTFMGLPLVDFNDVQNIFPPSEYGMFICLGYTNMNSFRAQKMSEAEEKGYEILSYTHPTAVVNAKSMGKGNIIMENVTIGAFAEIGDGNVFWANAHVAHHTHVGNFNFFTISVAVAGNIKIGDFCFFGNNCTIKNGIDIGNKTLVGAGCYVSKSTEPNGVYVPQRSIKLEDKVSTDFI